MIQEVADPVGYRLLSQEQLFARFQTSGSISKHLLVLYSLVIGVRARVIVELGLGQSTGALRAAAVETQGTVYTCDFDKRRFAYALSEQDAHWKLYLEDSASFILKVPQPFDFVMHDAAHHYSVVKRDLEMILPRMRKFGIICIHDTQQPNHSKDMLGAIRDACKGFSVSITNLPFSAGLAIVRVEDSPHPPIEPSTGTLEDGRSETELLEFPTVPAENGLSVTRTRNLFLAAKIRLGHLLRQAGLKS